jgi:protein TonB
MVRVETQPAGMHVWVDGAQAGPSPLILRDLSPGTHRIRVVEPGYAPAELTLELARGTTAAPLRFVMTPVKGDGQLAAIPPVTSVAAPRVAPTRKGDFVELDATNRPPRQIEGPTPSYPDEARRLKLSGSVLIDMIVTEKGRPERIRVLESAGAVLDEAVIEAVGRWRFEPASKSGVRVRTRWQYRHTFLLR